LSDNPLTCGESTALSLISVLPAGRRPGQTLLSLKAGQTGRRPQSRRRDYSTLAAFGQHVAIE
jgi:hypothetical protein